jgi:hypothetical protein
MYGTAEDTQTGTETSDGHDTPGRGSRSHVL